MSDHTYPEAKESRFEKFNFVWTDEKVAELARMISEERERSDVWSTDLTAEKSGIQFFKRNQLAEAIHKYLEPHTIEKGTKYIIDIDKFNEAIGYLFNQIEF